MKKMHEHGHHTASPDEYSFKDECLICGVEHTMACCPNNNAPTNYVKDTPFSSYARKSLPDGLHVKDMQNGAKTVVAKKIFPQGTLFGPLVAKTSKSRDIRIDFPIMIFRDGEGVYLDTYDECSSNWMSLILPATCIEEQNLVCVQSRHQIFFRTIKELHENEELKVWYAPAYAQIMGMSLLTNRIDQRKRKPAVESIESPGQGSEPLPVSPLSLGAREIRETWQCRYCDYQGSCVASYARHLMTHFQTSNNKGRVVCPYCKTGFRSESENSKEHISLCKELHKKNRQPCDEIQLIDNTVNSKTIMPKPMKPKNTQNSDLPSLKSKEQRDTTEDCMQRNQTVVAIGLENGNNSDPLLNTGKNSDPLIGADNSTASLEELADSFLTNSPVKKRKTLDLTKETDFPVSMSLVDLYNEDCSLDKPTSWDMFNSKPDLLLAEATDDFHQGGRSLFAQPTLATCDDIMEEERNGIVENLLSETEHGSSSWISSDFDMNDGCGVPEKINDKENKDESAKVKRKVKGGAFVCDICGRNFEKPFYLHRHLRKHTGDFRCFACQKVFARKESLMAHSRARCKGQAKAQLAQISCELCPSKFSSLQTLKVHMKDHFCKGINWKCLYCAITSEETTSIQDHQCSSAQVLVSCLTCHKECKSSNEFEQHKTKIELRVCGHIKSKTGAALHKKCTEKPLDEHMKSHSSPSMECPTCKMRFNRQTLLYSHMWTAHKVAQFRCHICKKVYSHKSNLSKHIKKHQRMIECKQCGHLSADMHHHCRHCDDHSPRRYRCTLCPAVFSQEGMLKTHIRCKHENKNRCSYCSATFVYLGRLRLHLAAKHAALRAEWDSPQAMSAPLEEKDDPESVATGVGLKDLNANIVVNAHSFDKCSTVNPSGLQLISNDAENLVIDTDQSLEYFLRLEGINIQSSADDSTVWIEEGIDLDKSLSDPVNIMSVTLPETYQGIDASGWIQEDSTSIVVQTQHNLQGNDLDKSLSDPVNIMSVTLPETYQGIDATGWIREDSTSVVVQIQHNIQEENDDPGSVAMGVGLNDLILNANTVANSDGSDKFSTVDPSGQQFISNEENDDLGSVAMGVGLNDLILNANTVANSDGSDKFSTVDPSGQQFISNEENDDLGSVAMGVGLNDLNANTVVNEDVFDKWSTVDPSGQQFISNKP